MSGVANGAQKAPNISKAGSGLPSRVIFHAVEGLGKTTLGAYSVKPLFLMTRGETGLLTLLDNGLVPETDHFDEALSWADLLFDVNFLVREPRESRTLVLDTLNGAERLCFEHVCRQRFKGDMQDFMAYGRGPEVAQEEWVNFLTLLDKLRAARRMAVIALCHTKVKTFKNPEGHDYDRYTPDMHEKIWGLTHKWADVVLFGNFETFAEKERGAMRAKGQGGQNRLLYTQRTAAWDAKNRVGLPPEIPLGRRPEDGWANFLQAMKDAKQTTNTQQKGAE